MTLEEQIHTHFGLTTSKIKHLNTLVNDVVVVDTPSGKFALKLYNIASRSLKDVQWELDLVEHLVGYGAPVAKPVKGKRGYVETFIVDGQERAAALFEWVPGEKPKPSHETYILLGKVAAEIHKAADDFTPASERDTYDADVLIDEQLQRMKASLVEVDRWEQMVALGERMKLLISNPKLDYGICHMDLTLDNVHRNGDELIVFDFDSAGTCWRAYEPYGTLRFSRNYFQDWLEGYRSVRPFSQEDEKAVAAFGIIGDIRNTVWKLGFAKSSRGEPLLQVSELPNVIDEWLEWEKENI